MTYRVHHVDGTAEGPFVQIEDARKHLEPGSCIGRGSYLIELAPETTKLQKQRWETAARMGHWGTSLLSSRLQASRPKPPATHPATPPPPPQPHPASEDEDESYDDEDDAYEAITDQDQDTDEDEHDIQAPVSPNAPVVAPGSPCAMVGCKGVAAPARIGMAIIPGEEPYCRKCRQRRRDDKKRGKTPRTELSNISLQRFSGQKKAKTGQASKPKTKPTPKPKPIPEASSQVLPDVESITPQAPAECIAIPRSLLHSVAKMLKPLNPKLAGELALELL